MHKYGEDEFINYASKTLSTLNKVIKKCTVQYITLYICSVLSLSIVRMKGRDSDILV